MKKALLIIDRGSRVEEVKTELKDLCEMTGSKGGYQYCNYCFLEVVPPFINEGIAKCVDSGSDFITIMPYFLYPGMKLKDTVKQSAIFCRDQNLRLVITKPLCYHDLMINLLKEKIENLKEKKGLKIPDSEIDLLMIGHGSSDKNARHAFLYSVEKLKPLYRNVEFCFLELDTPNIEQGISNILKKNPKNVVLLPYFLHNGIHLQKDIPEELERVTKTKSCNFEMHIAEHLGVNEKLVDMILQRAVEAENKIVF